MTSVQPAPDATQDIPVYVVDAFTDQPFRGNPAGVCVLPSPLPDAQLLAIARELRHSETAFVLEEAGGGRGRRIRWFAAGGEMPLCGHATLGAAAVLWQREDLEASGSLEFDSLSGPLVAHREAQGIRLDFPSDPPEPIPVPPHAVALGIEAVEAAYSPRLRKLLLRVATVEEVMGMRADPGVLMGVAWDHPVGGVILTAAYQAPGSFDFVSRYFNPWVGVPEDPVTGSAHTVLAPFWAERLGKPEFRAWQASERSGELGVRLRGDRVDLVGQARIVLSGALHLGGQTP